MLACLLICTLKYSYLLTYLSKFTALVDCMPVALLCSWGGSDWLRLSFNVSTTDQSAGRGVRQGRVNSRTAVFSATFSRRSVWVHRWFQLLTAASEVGCSSAVVASSTAQQLSTRLSTTSCYTSY